MPNSYQKTQPLQVSVLWVGQITEKVFEYIMKSTRWQWRDLGDLYDWRWGDPHTYHYCSSGSALDDSIAEPIVELYWH